MVTPPLHASAMTAGALLSTSIFQVPNYQREYSWTEDEVIEFWNDLKLELSNKSYFMGLVILTEEEGRKQIVDGQQRILTLTLLAAALYHEALATNRKALAERIAGAFLHSIDYETDESVPRVVLSDPNDDKTLKHLLSIGLDSDLPDNVSFSGKMLQAFRKLRALLKTDLNSDEFKRLGTWADFLTNHLYFAVFIHPDTAAAYRVFEVINTRGKELSTADLLKNFVLSRTPDDQKLSQYHRWQTISRPFIVADTDNDFVLYIRHVVTVESGYIQPQDLYDFLAARPPFIEGNAPSPDHLMSLLEKHQQLYLQMIDPTLDGPADPDSLRIFAALNALQVISARPLLLAICEKPNPNEGLQYILRLVVRRIVVGNLASGGIERRFGDAAKLVKNSSSWEVIVEELKDLNPARQAFIDQLATRSFNKAQLTFLRRSILQKSIMPNELGKLHYICPRNAFDWMTEEQLSYWSSTIGNTLLSAAETRPKDAHTWDGVKDRLLPKAIPEEWIDLLSAIDQWDGNSISQIGQRLAEVASDVWY